MVAVVQLLGGLSDRRNQDEDRFDPESKRFAGLVRIYPILQGLGALVGNYLFSRWSRWAKEDASYGHHCTPITIASFFDLIQVVRQQLDSGVSVKDDTLFGITPLLYAIHGDSATTARFLLQKGRTRKPKQDPDTARHVMFLAIVYALSHSY